MPLFFPTNGFCSFTVGEDQKLYDPKTKRERLGTVSNLTMWFDQNENCPDFIFEKENKNPSSWLFWISLLSTLLLSTWCIDAFSILLTIRFKLLHLPPLRDDVRNGPVPRHRGSGKPLSTAFLFFLEHLELYWWFLWVYPTFGIDYLWKHRWKRPLMNHLRTQMKPI